MAQMPLEDQPDFEIESRTQTVEQIQKVLADEGYDGFDSSTITDHPEAEPEAAAEPDPEAEAATEAATDESTDPATEEAAVDPAEPVAAIPAATTEAAAVPAKSKPGSAREKERRQRAEADLLKEREQSAALLKRIEALEQSSGKPATPAPPAVEKPVAVAPAPAKATVPGTVPATIEVPAAEAEPTEPEESAYTDYALYKKDHAKWVKDVTRWAIKDDERQKVIRSNETAQAARVQEETDRAAAAQAQLDAERDSNKAYWDEQIPLARASHADFDAVMANPPAGLPPWSGALLGTLADSPIGGEVLYYLGTHHDELVTLVKDTMLPDSPTPKQMRVALTKAAKVIESIEQKIEAAGKLAAPPADETTDEATEEVEETDSVDDADIDLDSEEELAPEPVKPLTKPAPVTQAKTAPAKAATTTPAKPATAPVKAGATAKPTPTPKFNPPEPIKNRGTGPRKKLPLEMTMDELRDLPMEEYAKFTAMKY